ncbi:putative acetylesterase [Flavihumibacter petaseus NBRC 106054]|uniref:Putative acetylesterase n=2 Tax=Flavihumibacter TaxID=1004301 RepID=A0A0E9N0D2_9BACT|nr:putative acetylesterase [Flavihumibacter petaseus NBRC 106054]
MVLQRERALTIWGWAGKNEKITVSFHDQKQTTKADKQGKWSVELSPEVAGGPFELVVSGKGERRIKNILLGDVWLCSGQSNMEWNVRSSNNAEQVIAGSANDRIRHFAVAKTISDKPLDNVKAAAWEIAGPATTGNFTAVGYFFAKTLEKELGVPVGLVHSSWGGTDVETWTSREALADSKEFHDLMTGLPKLNLDSLAAKKNAEAAAVVTQLQGKLPDAATVARFPSVEFDQRSWPEMQLPELWETQQLKNFDGVVWFRKTIQLTKEQAAQAATLLLGTIDDSDDTYVNGKKVGATMNSYNVERRYVIPAGLLKEGVNVIAIRVEDTGGGGGVYGGADRLQLTLGDQHLPLAGKWALQVERLAATATSVGPNSYPSLLYNGMIHPLLKFPIKGAIWYQGENNAGRAAQYATAFPVMINDWRKGWEEGNFPFYFVQLSSFIAGDGDSRKGSAWAELREAQTQTLVLPQTGMAVTIDVGERNDIHPRNKQDVGYRLALQALKKTYGKGVVADGPVFSNMEIDGNEVRLGFANADGLMAKGSDGVVLGFDVAGADRKFYPVTGKIENGKVVLQGDAAQKPVAVRYAWADDAGKANLFNGAGLPAQPFRTDHWEGITEKNKYQGGN